MRAYVRTALIAAAFVLAGCADSGLPSDLFTSPGASKAIEGLHLSADSIALPLGKMTVLSARLLSHGEAKKPENVTWKTGDSTVAKVDSAGTVTAVGPGTTTVTATTTEKTSAEPTATATSTATATVTVPSSTPTTSSASAAQTSVATGASPELPRATVDVSMPAVTGHSIQVNAGGDLQAALNNAQPGDEIVLQAGATFTGPFKLPVKSGAGWIIVRSSGTLPNPGTRVHPSDAAQMPKLVSADPTAPVIQTAPGAHNYRLIGLEVTANPGVTMAYTLVALGDGSSAQNTAAQLPQQLVLDRMYVHGTPTLDFQRCIGLNSGSTAIIDSYISECHAKAMDSQAIAGWNGSGPYRIENDYLEGAGENVMFGGADPAIANQVPSDIVFRGNYVIKPLAWMGTWEAKNLLELKLGQRVLIQDNVFENSWVNAQVGFAIVMWSADQGGRATWSHTGDVTFRSNLIKNVAGGFQLTATGDLPAVPMSRVEISNTVMYGVGASSLGSNGVMYQIGGAIADLHLIHNSGLSPRHGVYFVSTPQSALPGLVIRDNIFGGGSYQMFSSFGQGNTAWTQFAGSGSACDHNVIVGGSGMPAGNSTPASVASVGFVNDQTDLNLASSSAYKGTASDRTDPGADVTSVSQAVAPAVLP